MLVVPKKTSEIKIKIYYYNYDLHSQSLKFQRIHDYWSLKNVKPGNKTDTIIDIYVYTYNVTGISITRAWEIRIVFNDSKLA